jgi:hypothetical protein
MTLVDRSHRYPDRSRQLRDTNHWGQATRVTPHEIGNDLPSQVTAAYFFRGQLVGVKESSGGLIALSGLKVPARHIEQVAGPALTR